MVDDVERATGPVDVPTPEPGPASSLLDPRVLQILSAELSSLQSARALAYNEAFTRAGMFLAFLSFSFVGLALVAQAIPVDRSFQLIAALVLAFDFVVGLTTYGRIVGTSYEDYRAVHGMARIRHGYSEIAPVVVPYLTTATHDDLVGVMVSYGSPATSGLSAVAYQLTTSGTMIGLIVSMIGGVFALVVGLAFEASLAVAFGVGAAIAFGVFLALVALTARFYLRVQAAMPVLFPTPPDR